MSKSGFKYRIQLIVLCIVAWELIFWGVYYILVNTIIGGATKAGSDILMYKYPEGLNLILLLIPLFIVYVLNLRKHNRMIKDSNNRLLSSVLKPVSSSSSFIKYFLFRNAVIFLIIALSQPIFGKKRVSGTSETLELVVCLDVSNSMNTKDVSIEISRLDISKRALIQLVNNLHGEKIGISLFANSAFVQLPLTRDYSAAKLFIQEIETDMISSQGTNISEALEVSLDMFSKEQTTKGIILVTDGENHERNPDEILEEIKESKMQLSVLGIGTQKGGLIPKNPNRPELGYKTNAVGKTIVSKLNPSFIQKIASKGGGKASVSSNEFPNLSELLTQINQMKRTKIDNLEFDVKEEQFQIPLFISLIFWIAYIFWSNRFLRIFDRITIKK